MAKEFEARPVADTDIDQVIITRSTDKDTGAVVYRVRANVKVVIRDKASPDKEESINIPLNKTDVEMGLKTQVAAIRDAVLKYAQAENSEVVKKPAKVKGKSKK